MDVPISRNMSFSWPSGTVSGSPDPAGEENGAAGGHISDVLFFRSLCVDPETGALKPDGGTQEVNWEPIKVTEGTELVWKDGETAEWKLYFYTEEVPGKYIYTYDYETESNWTSYCREKSLLDWQTGGYRFPEAGYFRLLIRRDAEPARTDFKETGAAQEKTSPPFMLRSPELREGKKDGADCFAEERRAVTERVRAVRKPEDALLFLFADTHYTVNGNFEDTEENAARMAEALAPDAAVHLGDLTDGLLPEILTKQFAGRVLQGLARIGAPLYLCLGNHDANYFRGNPEKMGQTECARFYLGQKTGSYCRDLPEKKLRMIFLDSFDPEGKTREKRYGFSPRTCLYLTGALARTPREYGVLVFSHVPLLPSMHVWSRGIRGSRAVTGILEHFQRRRHTLLAFIHGHSHADQVNETLSFPIVSVGCGKLESFPEHKPEGAVTYGRRQGTASAELWDIVRVNAEKGETDLIRFGAGEDRHLRIRQG